VDLQLQKLLGVLLLSFLKLSGILGICFKDCIPFLPSSAIFASMKKMVGFVVMASSYLMRMTMPVKVRLLRLVIIAIITNH
jgi:hypothetical protein